MLSSFDTGEHLKEIWKVRRQGQAFQEIRDESGERPSRFAQALAHVIKVNNEKINNYTPNQPQFQLIAEINKSILVYNEHMSTPTLKEDLNTLGVTQEDWLTVRGVLETARIYEYGVSARERANSNLNYSSKYFKEDVSKVMAGEQVYVAVASHKVKCQSQDGPAPVNPLFLKLGKAAQNIVADRDGFKFFKKIAQGFENLKGVQKLCDSAKSTMEKVELANDITRLRKEAVNFMTAELEAKLGMDYQVQAVKEVQKDNLEKNINEPKIEAPEIKAPKIEEGGLVI